MKLHLKNTLVMLVSTLSLLSLGVDAQDYHFSQALLSGVSSKTDLSLFEQGGQLPGTYPVDVEVNGERMDLRDVVFSLEHTSDNHPLLVPCLSRKLLAGYGLRVEKFPEAGEACFRLSAVPGGLATLNFSTQTLAISIPQLYMRPTHDGIAPEMLWDDGETVFRMNYQASSTWERSKTGISQSSRSDFVQLTPGLNIGPWRLRNITNWQETTGRRGQWQTLSTYAERGLNGLKSRLTLGERYTSSDIFDSVPFRGAMLDSDDAMVPASQYMYSPVIRGVARTQARVEVKQNGYTLYNRVVAPGPFALRNLSPSGAGGDMKVTVWEMDGRPQVFTVPYQAPAVGVKEGYLRYGLMAGKYWSNGSGVVRAPVAQATAMYGLHGGVTLYGGFQGAKHFQAAALGFGVSLGELGALSADVTRSQAQSYLRRREIGNAVRLRYSKYVQETGTALALAAWKYDQNGYNTLSNVLDTWHKGKAFGNTAPRQKSRIGVTLSQDLGGWGYLNFSGYQERYRDRTGSDMTVNAGYSVPIGEVTVSLNWSQSRYFSNGGEAYTDRVTSLWLSVPMGSWTGGNTTASWRWTQPSSGGATHSLGINGSSFAQRLNWSVSQQYRPESPDDRNDGSLSLNWDGSYGQVGGNYSYSPGMSQTGVTLDGGVVVHRHGITLSQPLGDTLALVEAPGASGVSVEGLPGVKTDFRGYTTAAWLQPYQPNTLSLNRTELPADVDIAETDVKVVPTEGAVVAARFITRTGGRGLITLTQSNGHPVPFGALATQQSGAGGSGVVGSGGQAFMTGLGKKGRLKVKWSDGTCQAEYRLPSAPGAAGIYHISAACR